MANAYGAGLTDWDQSSLYGKLCIFAFAAWGGRDDGVIAGLAVCGIMLSVTSAACGEVTLRSLEMYTMPSQKLFCRTDTCRMVSDMMSCDVQGSWVTSRQHISRCAILAQCLSLR